MCFIRTDALICIANHTSVESVLFQKLQCGRNIWKQVVVLLMSETIEQTSKEFVKLGIKIYS